MLEDPTILVRGDRITGLAARYCRRIERGELGFDTVFSENRLEELAVETREAKVWNVPTLVVYQHVPPNEVRPGDPPATYGIRRS